jgi:putative membrane protein
MNGINDGMGIGWGWIIGLIVLIIIVWIIVKMLNRKPHPTLPVEKSPLDILKERYVRGEISKQEYEEKRKAVS